ncbi:MAG TPA: group I intron-associated PD-(D/E)XK endonuclease [Solirubrobacterales bacterium]|nr:group I intron-associated PD-(D/E)XK endonuclease [Solirubrobacterales bacterium]
MKTATKGNEAEAMILCALIERGFEVSVPFGSGQPYDLVVDLGGFDLLKVQCKTGWLHKGCISFNARSTDHGQGRRPYVGLAHIFGVYFPPTRSVYLVPLDVAGFNGRLRLEPTLNSQQKGVRYAADYEVDRWSVERLLEVKREAEVAAEPALNIA